MNNKSFIITTSEPLARHHEDTLKRVIQNLTGSTDVVFETVPGMYPSQAEIDAELSDQLASVSEKLEAMKEREVFGREGTGTTARGSAEGEPTKDSDGIS
jgi:hypothetical protein